MDKIKKENQTNGVIINMQLKIFDFNSLDKQEEGSEN